MSTRRLFIKGLPADIGEAELESRFKSFGSVSQVSLARNSDGSCRGFGHLTMEAEEAGWKKCLTALNGSSWKGGKIKIEDAKEDYKTRLERERTQPVKVSKHTKLRRRLARHAADMTLVDEKNVEGRKGWRRGKFGRPIAIMTLRRLDRTLVVMDPSHDPTALDKFYEGYRPRPVRRLTWFDPSLQGFDNVQISAEKSEDDDDEDMSMEEDDEIEVEEAVMEEDLKPAHVSTRAEEILEKQPSKSWDDVVSGQGFSLSLALNLPAPEPVATVKSSAKKEEERSEPIIRSEFDLHALLYDFTSILSQTPVQEDLFMCHGSKLESVALWKAGRSEIRKDFKKQAKTAKRQIRKKQTLIRNIKASAL